MAAAAARRQPQSAAPMVGVTTAGTERDQEPPKEPQFPPRYKPMQKVGEGAYGKVYKCEDTEKDGGTQVAIKWVHDFAQDPLSGKRTLREIRLLAALRHENLMRLLDLLPVPSPNFDDVYIVMIYMQSDLNKVIYNPRMKLSDSHVQAFVCQILRGLKYLHSAGVVHRDLKPANVLVNKDCTIRIADFGLSRGRVNDRSEQEYMTEYVVTRWYRSPELLLEPSCYFEAIDLWAAGCIHYELLARQAAFPGKDPNDMLVQIVSIRGFSPDRDLQWVPDASKRRTVEMAKLLSLSTVRVVPLEARLPQANEACLGLLHRALCFDPHQRISAIEAIEHEYLRHLRDPEGEKSAPRQFSWEFDTFDPSQRALKDRVYAECARLHPEMIERDLPYLRERGFVPRDERTLAPHASGTAPLGPASRNPTAPGAAGPVEAEGASMDLASAEISS